MCKFFSNKQKQKYIDNGKVKNRDLKKSQMYKTNETIDIMKENEKNLAMLAELTTNEEVKAKINKMVDKIKFANPSPSKEVMKKDEQIGKEIADLKIAILSKKDKDEVINKHLLEIKILIEERCALK